jgi:hypothetical protein
MPQHWTGTPPNGCSGCGYDFTSTRLFDAHRVGRYEPFERRCLDVEEMQAKGWEQDERGRWVDPVRVQATREAFAKAA